MAGFTGFPFCRFFYLFLFVLPLFCQILTVEGDYILYSRDQDYIFACGNLRVRAEGNIMQAAYLYFSVASMKGRLFSVRWMGKEYDELIIELNPFRWEGFNYSAKVKKEGKAEAVQLLPPSSLRQARLYYEARSLSLYRNGKITARTVVPYLYGLPALPVSSLVLRAGRMERTGLAFERIRLSGSEGLSLSLRMAVRESFWTGDYHMRFYERELLGLEGTERGLVVSGQGSAAFCKGCSLFSSLSLSPENNMYTFSLGGGIKRKGAEFKLIHRVSRTGGMEWENWLMGYFTLSPLKGFSLKAGAGWDYRRSRFVSATAYYKREEFLLGLDYIENRLERENYQFSSRRLNLRLGYTNSLLNFSSSFLFNRDLLTLVEKKDLNLNLSLTPFSLLERSLNFNIKFFALFSSIENMPSGKRFLPGGQIMVEGRNFLLPAGVEFVPLLQAAYISGRRSDWMEINYTMRFSRQLGPFKFFFDFSQLSRLKAEGFFVEGNSARFWTAGLEFKGEPLFYEAESYWKEGMGLEAFRMQGRIKMLYGAVKFFLLYSGYLRKFTGFEAFFEKDLRGLVLQAGYSMTLKRFFLRLVQR